MNLADAIRKAAEKGLPEAAPAKAWDSSTGPKAKPEPVENPIPHLQLELSEPEHVEIAGETADEQDEVRIPEPRQEDQQAPYFPEPPTVTTGNVVRLELFLNSEQMTGLLKAILAGQHSVLTLKEAAAYLRISPNSLQELAEQGEVPGVQMNGAWRFPKSSLDEWMTLSAVKRLGSQMEDAENVA